MQRSENGSTHSLSDHLGSMEDISLLQSGFPHRLQDRAKLAAINTAGIACLVGLGYILVEAYQSTARNNHVIMVCQVAASAMIRGLIEANLAMLNHTSRPTVVEHVMNWPTRYCFYLYEILWNASLNTTDATALQILMSLRQALIGFTITGDISLFLRQNRANRIPLELLEQRPIINRLLEPDYNSPAQIPFYMGSVALGVGAIATGYFLGDQVEGLELFASALGLYLISSWAGYGAMHGIARLWKHLEERQVVNFSDQINGGDVGPPQVPWQLRLLRNSVASIHQLVLEAMCVLPDLVRPAAINFIPIGVGYGAMERLSLERFQTLQLEDITIIERERYRGDPSLGVTRRAVRVNQVTTALFFLLYTTWFSYGLATSGKREGFEIGVLLTATLGIAVIGRVLNSAFVPGTHGRLMNQSVYRVLENPYNMLILYQAISQLTAISNQALSNAAPFVFGCGLLGQALFGALIGLDQIRPYRERETTTAIFVALAIEELIFDWISG